MVLVALKRSSSELSSYQKKILPVDDHVGVAIAGLTSDGRMLRWVWGCVREGGSEECSVLVWDEGWEVVYVMSNDAPLLLQQVHEDGMSQLSVCV